MIMQIRRDLKFSFDSINLSESPIRYDFNDTLTRVETITKKGEAEVRYGVLVDFEEEQGLFQKSYLLEIPVQESRREERQKAQEQVIRDYMEAMREKWRNFLKKAKKENESITYDEFDRVQRTIKSADGRWNLLRQFRKKEFLPFSKWLFQNESDKPSDFKQELFRCRMSFISGERYSITTDWALPYVTWEKAHKVAHLKSENPVDESLFQPFHNFAPNTPKLSTEITIERDRDYEANHKQGIPLKPTHYTLFSFYMFLIEEILRLVQEGYDRLMPYHRYVQNLGAIESVMIRRGPLRYKNAEELKAMKLDKKNWDGNIQNGSRYEEQLAMGIMDIMNLKELFSRIITEESQNGRNRTGMLRINSHIDSLGETFFSKQAQVCYEDLWTHNWDSFGIDLFLEKTSALLAWSDSAESVYNRFVKEKLYEHPILNDPKASFKNNSLDMTEWNNIFYRTENTTVNIWLLYYSVREGLQKVKNEALYQTKVVPTTPFTSKLAHKISSMKNLDYTPGFAGHGTPPQLYPEWRLSDVQIRKLANLLMGGSKIEELKQAEAKIAIVIKEVMGNDTYKEIPFNRLDQIRDMTLDIKRELISQDIPHNKDLPTRIGGPVGIAINLLLTKAAFDNAMKPNATTETKLRALTAALGLTSDVGNYAAEFIGIQATLSQKAAFDSGKKAAAKTGGKISLIAGRRLAMGLGTLEATAGGVGGVLGAFWYTYDGIGAYQMGYKKDAILDFVSAIGCAIGAYGVTLTGSIVGFSPGMLCSAAGFTIVLIAQLIKHTKALSNKPEEFCRDLYGNSLEEGGMDIMNAWTEELKKGIVKLPWEKTEDQKDLISPSDQKELQKLTSRVKQFLSDWDTFDKFSN